MRHHDFADNIFDWINALPPLWHWLIAGVGAFLGLVFFGGLVSEGEGWDPIFTTRNKRELLVGTFTSALWGAIGLILSIVFLAPCLTLWGLWKCNVTLSEVVGLPLGLALMLGFVYSVVKIVDWRRLRRHRKLLDQPRKPNRN